MLWELHLVKRCILVPMLGRSKYSWLQDTTGLMTSQELEMMAATVISPIVDGAYQSDATQLLYGMTSLRQTYQS